MKKSNQLINSPRIESLYNKVSDHIEQARKSILRTVDTEMVKAYWLIGQDIIQEEQHGEQRAEYGKSLLKTLAERLQKKYQRGFGVDTLEQARKFYLSYQITSTPKSDALRRKSDIPSFHPNLSWTHYRELMRIANLDAKNFYEAETINNGWSSRELKRQIGSLLYDRLLKSKNKQNLLNIAYKGQEINSPEDAIKDPLILEFLGLPESHRLTESKLEGALIENLKDFLLELGRGFAFMARQKRLTLDGNHFYADLVMYHVILKCYVIIDVKINPLTHGDLGQMLLYTNYFDQEIKMKNDNPTIGLVLCTEKSDAMVKYTLGDKAKQIFASKYQFHLPTVEELEAELKREIKQIKHKLEDE